MIGRADRASSGDALHRRGFGGDRDRPELAHQPQVVVVPPMLGDSAIGDAHDMAPGHRDGPAGGWEAEEFPKLGAAHRRAGHNFVSPSAIGSSMRHPILEYIDRERGSRTSYLARHANITPQAMGELVNHLAAHSYVERAPDPSDGWARLVRLTARGRDAYALAARLVTELEASWAAALGEDKMRRLKRLLGDLWDAIEPDPREHD